MTCPNCGTNMHDIVVDNQQVLQCDNCGGSFFDENEINRISAKAALQLERNNELRITNKEDASEGADFLRPGPLDGRAPIGDKKTVASELSHEIRPHFCPKDHGVLLPLHNEETIPHNINLLQCTECKGIFATPENLSLFKRAQEAKIEYFRLWAKPLPSLHAVLLFSFLLIISLATFASFNRLAQPQTQNTQAEEVVTRFSATASGRYVIITFHTDRSYSSQITLINKSTGEQTLKEISKEPIKTHLVTITIDEPNSEYFYRLRLIDEKGKVTEVEERKLEISK